MDKLHNYADFFDKNGPTFISLYSLENQKAASLFRLLLIGHDGQYSIKSGILGLGGDYSSNIVIQTSEIANDNGRK